MNKNYKKLITYAIISALTLNAKTIVKAQGPRFSDYIDKEIYVKALTNVNIRKDTSIESDILGLLEEGQKLKYISEYPNWYIVEYNNNYAFISKDYVELVQKQKNYSKDIMGIVLEETLMYNDIGPKTIDKYSIGKIIEENDSYYYLKFDDQEGYINKDNIDILTDTYIIVDISDQELSLYEKGELLLKTPVVTGLPTKDRQTDQGYFSIFEIRHDTDLIGVDYRSHVDVMMKYNKNEGIHDANRWRSSYGGEIYKTNGSHGCVNTPRGAAIEVSKNVEIGTKVLVRE